VTSDSIEFKNYI